MARINVDDKWLKDPRRDDFVKAVGDSDKADGLTLRYWRLGQEAHSIGKLVNKKQFMRMPFAKEFLACELAEEREGGIYIKGTKRRAKYLVERIEAAKKGGKKSATRPRDENGRLLPKRKGSVSQPSKPPTEHQVKPSEAKLHVHSHVHVPKEGVLVNTKTPQLPSEAAHAAIALYCKCYKARYGHNPEVGGKQQGLLKRFTKDHPSTWAQLIEGYFLLPDTWLIQRAHPVESLHLKINEIKRFRETGKVVTRGQVTEFNEKLEETMGTRPPTISEILAEEKEAQLQLNGGSK